MTFMRKNLTLEASIKPDATNSNAITLILCDSPSKLPVGNEL